MQSQACAPVQGCGPAISNALLVIWAKTSDSHLQASTARCVSIILNLVITQPFFCTIQLVDNLIPLRPHV
jgi:hypothetical protein